MRARSARRAAEWGRLAFVAGFAFLMVLLVGLFGARAGHEPAPELPSVARFAPE